MRRRVSFDTFASCWIHSVDSIKWIPVRLSVMAFHTGSLCFDVNEIGTRNEKQRLAKLSDFELVRVHGLDFDTNKDGK